jgi:hypothetical protein
VAAGDESVITQGKPRLRICANHALNTDPTEHGKLMLTIAVAANGEVGTVTIAANTGLSAQSAACMSRAMRNLMFPTGNARTLTLAVVQTKNPS